MAGRSDFIILSIRLTIRPQNDRLALPYSHGGTLKTAVRENRRVCGNAASCVGLPVVAAPRPARLADHCGHAIGRLLRQFQPAQFLHLASGAAAKRAGAALGTGEVKVGLILPLSAGGNAGIAGQSMRNAAEMAIAEFNSPNITLLVKDDGGTAEAARLGAQQAIDEGAEIILGPLFAQSVSVVGQVARVPKIPVIAFSTDTNVASAGVYLLSFLPESDVERIVQYAASTGKRSYAALIPDNPYGTVVEAAFKQAVARRNGQLIALERYPHDKAGIAGPVRNVAQTAARIDALFIPDGGDTVPDIVQA